MDENEREFLERVRAGFRRRQEEQRARELELIPTCPVCKARHYPAITHGQVWVWCGGIVAKGGPALRIDPNRITVPETMGEL